MLDLVFAPAGNQPCVALALPHLSATVPPWWQRCGWRFLLSQSPVTGVSPGWAPPGGPPRCVPVTTSLSPTPACLQLGSHQRGERPGQVPTRARRRVRQHGHRWVAVPGDLGVPGAGTGGLRGGTPVPVPPAGGGRGLSGCLCQVGSSTPASPRTSSAATPASSAARGRALRCAPRWTSACSMVTVPPAPWHSMGGTGGALLLGFPHPFPAVMRGPEVAAVPFVPT